MQERNPKSRPGVGDGRGINTVRETENSNQAGFGLLHTEEPSLRPFVQVILNFLKCEGCVVVPEPDSDPGLDLTRPTEA